MSIKSDSGDCIPYIGLRHFEEKDRKFFKGRRQQVSDVLERLDKERFLAIVGQSGGGKSSLVLAGVLHALRRDRLTHSGPEWLLASMRPAAHPLRSLAVSLRSSIKSYLDAAGHCDSAADEWSANLDEILKTSGSVGFVRAIAEADLPSLPNVLLVVDQFEELFRYKQASEKRGDAELFVDQLIHATSESGASNIFVIVTMRSDFLGEAAKYCGLAEAINRGLYLIPRLQRDEVLDAIRLPARECNGTIEEKLIARLANDIIGEPDQLPLLQHALMRCWEVSTYPTELVYDAKGGKEALQQHLNELYGEFEALGKGKIVERLFKRLTKIGNLEAPDQENFAQAGIREEASLELISQQTGFTIQELADVINRFRGPYCSFLRPSPKEEFTLTPHSTIDITHESLIRRWDKLGGTNIAEGWLKQEFDARNHYLDLVREAPRSSKGGSSGGFVALPEARVDQYLALEETVWGEAWAQRYASEAAQYANALNYLHDCQKYYIDLKLRFVRGLEEERLKQERESASKLEAQERQTEERLAAARKAADNRQRLILISAAIVIIVISFAFYLGRLIHDNRAMEANSKELVARKLGNLAADLAAQGGSFSQERSALLSVVSRKTKSILQNSDLTSWRSYERIAQPAAVSSISTFDGGISFISFSERLPTHLLVRGKKGDKTKVVSLATDGDRLQEETYVHPKVDMQFYLLSDDGKLSATQCSTQQGVEAVPCVIEVESGRKVFMASGPGVPRVLNNSEDRKALVLGYEAKDHSLVLESAVISPSGVAARVMIKMLSIARNENAALIAKVSGDGNFIALRYPSSDLASRNNQFDLKVFTNGAAKRNPPSKVTAAKSARHDESERSFTDVVDAKISPKDEYLAIGFNGAREVQVFALEDLKRLSQGALESAGVTVTHAASITALAFSQKYSSYLATASSDGEIRVSELNQADSIGPPGAHLLWNDHNPLPVQVIAFNPKNELLAIGNLDNTTRVYHVQSGTELMRVTHKAAVSAVAFNSDGTQLASGGNDGIIMLIAPDKVPRARLASNISCSDGGIPVDAQLGQQGGYLAVECVKSQERSDRLQTSAWAEYTKIAGASLFKIGAPRAATTQEVSSPCVVDLGQGSSPILLSVCPDSINGKRAGDSHATLIQAKPEGKVTVAALGRSSDGKDLFVTSSVRDRTNSPNGILQVFSGANGGLLCEGDLDSEARTIAFSERYLAVGTSGSQLYIYPVDICEKAKNNDKRLLREPLFRLTLPQGHGPEITALSFSSGSRYIGIGTASLAAVYEIGRFGLSRTLWIRQGYRVRTVAFDAETKWFASGDQRGEVKVVQLDSEQTRGAKGEEPVDGEFTIEERFPIFAIGFPLASKNGGQSIQTVTLADGAHFTQAFSNPLTPTSVSITDYQLTIQPDKICEQLSGPLHPDDWKVASKGIADDLYVKVPCAKLGHRNTMPAGIPRPDWK